MDFSSEFWAALTGAVVGGGLTILGQWFHYIWTTRAKRARDDTRKVMLRKMLDNPGPTGWRTMKTLSNVIGASRDETAQLLIECGARASETGNDSWAYEKHKPLPTSSGDANA